MRRSFFISTAATILLLTFIGLDAQVVVPTVTTTDTSGDVTLTATTADPETRAVLRSLELYCLNPRACTTPAARICYDYVRSSGAISRTACRSATDADVWDAVDATGTAAGNSLFDVLAPRTSTAQPANDWQRLQSRLRNWTQSQGQNALPELTATTATALRAPTTSTTTTAGRRRATNTTTR